MIIPNSFTQPNQPKHGRVSCIFKQVDAILLGLKKNFFTVRGASRFDSICKRPARNQIHRKKTLLTTYYRHEADSVASLQASTL